MRVELLWWDGCPSWPRALEQLRQVLSEEGVDPEAVEMREVRTDAEAQAERFPGSPTIRIDGEDVQPPGETTPVSLTCRVYRLRDGRPSPIPDGRELRELVQRKRKEAT